MNVTIINDCRDDNAKGRQLARTAALFNAPVSFVGVQNDLEAAGNLIDIIDAYHGAPGVILVNVAPRNGKAKKWENGTPFGYFWVGELLIVSSIDGNTLSLAKKLRPTEIVNVMDIPTVMKEFVSKGILTTEQADHTIKTQFRSFDFLPRVAAYLWENKDVVSEATPLANFPDAPLAVWWIDNFGNCKTTALPSELAELGQTKELAKMKSYRQLKEVPDNEMACIVGSSGLGTKRFLEIVVQGQSAADKLGLVSGKPLT